MDTQADLKFNMFKHVFLQILTIPKCIWGYFSSYVGFWLDNRWLSHSRQ